MSIKKYLLFTFLTSFLALGTLQAHEWYPFACCSENDCHPISCSDIEEKGKNLVYHKFPFYGNMIKPSQDGECHVCISNESNKDFNPVPHCIFIQQGS